MLQDNSTIMPVDEIWKQLNSLTTSVNRDVQKMSQLLDQLITHTLSNNCDFLEIPYRKRDHIKKKEQYAKDYKQCILSQLNQKLNWTIVDQKNFCNKCQMIWKTRKGYLLHLLQKHCDYKFYLCETCNVEFDNFNQFKQHCNNHDEMKFQVTKKIQLQIDHGVGEIFKE